MDKLISQVIKDSLSQGMARRRNLLTVVSILLAIGWPALIYVAYKTRPLETYALVGLSAVALFSILMVPAWSLIKDQYFYRLATINISVYMAASVLQTANVLFGSTAPLYLAGTPPLMIASHQILIVMAFVFLPHYTARAATWTYTGSLALILLVHATLHFDDFTSFYGVALMGTCILLIMPASIIFMRVYIELHMNALATAQAVVEKSEAAAAQMEQANLTDSVTGARNREGLMTALGALMEQPQSFGLLVFKLQDQEKLRERLGDGIYERVLKEGVDLLADWTGDRQQVARREGSELIAWSAQLQNQDAIAQTGEQLLKLLNKTVQHLLSQETEISQSLAKTPVVFRVAGTLRSGHLDSAFMLEEVMFRLFMAKLRPNLACFEA